MDRSSGAFLRRTMTRVGRRDLFEAGHFTCKDESGFGTSELKTNKEGLS